VSDRPQDADGDALRRVAADGSDLSKPMTVDFMIAGRDEASARAIAAAAAALGYRTEAQYDDGRWTVYCAREMLLTYDSVVAAQAELDRIAQPLGGFSDGWGTFGNGPGPA
jgi:hypothetical protein